MPIQRFFARGARRVRRFNFARTIPLLVAFWGATCAEFHVASGQDLLELIGRKPSASVRSKPQFVTTLAPAAGTTDEVLLTIEMKLPAGYYTYGVEGDFGGKTRIGVEAPLLVPLDAEFSPVTPAHEEFEPVFKTTVWKHKDAVTWQRRYRRAPGANPSDVSASVRLEGQYCSIGTDESPGQCVPLVPPYEATVKLAAATSSEMPAGGSDAVEAAPVAYEQVTRLVRKNAKTGDKPDPIELTFRLSPQDAKPGDVVTLTITAKIDDGWHTYSITQPDVEGATATELDLEQLDGLIPRGDRFTPDAEPEVAHPEAIPGAIHEKHHGSVTWSREFTVAENRAPGDYGVKGRASYQVCDKRTCQPVKSIRFALGRVAPTSATSIEMVEVTQGTRQAVEPASSSPSPAKSTPSASITPALGSQGLRSFLVTALASGFLALLTPCVFPMIPITVSFFLKQAEKKRGNSLLLAAVYCGSIVAAFTGLGLGISAIFGATALTALANNPWMNFAIGAVFVAFSLSLLGMFEIAVPSWLLMATAGNESRGGYVGVVFMALTFTLTSFTCTFAFAGSLLVAAAQGGVFWPALGMLAFSTAFASPFFLLALFPSWLQRLPKGGGWMNSVKVVLGLVELGFALKFLSTADFAWNREPVIFDFLFVMLAWAALSMIAAAYLLGLFKLPHDLPTQHLSVGRLLLATGFLMFGGFVLTGVLAPGAAAGRLMPQLLAFAPPQVKSGQTELGPVVEHHGLQFALDLQKALPVAQRDRRPLFLDFTGVNCINCRLMEQKMRSPRNHELLEQLVGVQLYADVMPAAVADPKYANELLARNRALQTEWFGDVSLPSYAVVTPDGREVLSMFIGLEQQEGEFAKFLKEGIQKWQDRTLAASLTPPSP